MAASTDEPGARRARQAAPWVALALGLSWQGWLGMRWIRLDQSVCEGVFPYSAWPLSQLIERLEHGQLWGYLTSTWPPDLFSFTGVAGRALFGANPDSLLVTVLVLLLLTQLLIFDLGRWLGSPWAGVLAALLLPLAPDTAVMARRWAAQLPHMLLLVAAANTLLRSRSLTRPWPTVGFVVVVLLGMSYSVWLTDDLLFVGAAGSMAVGAVLRGLLFDRGPTPGDPPGRRRVALGSALTALVLAGGGWALIVHRMQLGYYVTESQAARYQALTPWSPQALSGYLRLMWTETHGPLLCVAALIGVGLLAWRGRGRGELLSWLLLPLLALSLIAKKNSYYLTIIYPVVPLVTALGLARLPRWWIRGPVMLALLAAAWVPWQRASFTASAGAPPRLGEYDPAFQTVNPPVLGYRSEGPYDRELRLIRTQRAAIQAVDDAVLCVLPQGELAELELAIEPLVPNATLWNRPVMAPCDWLLIRDPDPPPVEAMADIRRTADLSPHWRGQLQGRHFVLVNQDTLGTPALWLLQQRSTDAQTGSNP